MNTKITNYNETIKSLTEWLEALTDAADNDEVFDVAFFEATKDYPLMIIGGWVEGFSEKYADLCYVSKSEPKYAMCVKIAINDGQLCPDFESLNMPIDKNGEIDDTCLAIERDDDLGELAVWLLGEWERIMTEYRED
jgi:hypothetical protein